MENELQIKGDFPFKDDNTSQISCCSNSKWFALVMYIKYKNLGFESDERVWVVNLKADAENMSEIVDNKSVFPAYHMNKKNWITVVLTSVTDFDNLKRLTLRSKELVKKK